MITVYQIADWNLAKDTYFNILDRTGRPSYATSSKFDEDRFKYDKMPNTIGISVPVDQIIDGIWHPSV